MRALAKSPQKEKHTHRRCLGQLFPLVGTSSSDLAVALLTGVPLGCPRAGRTALLRERGGWEKRQLAGGLGKALVVLFLLPFKVVFAFHTVPTLAYEVGKFSEN